MSEEESYRALMGIVGLALRRRACYGLYQAVWSWAEAHERALATIGDEGRPAGERLVALALLWTPEQGACLRATDYAEFLASDYWQIIREAVLDRDEHRCSLCNDGEKLQVHHKTYEHRGMEVFCLEDLITLCDRCHATFHGKGNGQPSAT